MVEIAGDRLDLAGARDLEQTSLATQLEDDGVGTEGIFSFQGTVPTEITEAIEGRGALRFIFKGNDPRGSGSDALASIGTDGLVELAEQLAGGEGTTASRLAGNDPEASFFQTLTELTRAADRFDIIDDPSALPEGATFTVAEEPFRVELGDNGTVRLVPDIDETAGDTRATDPSALNVLESGERSPFKATEAGIFDATSGGRGLPIDRGSLQGAGLSASARLAQITARKAEAARKRLKDKLDPSTLRSGIDPTLFADLAIIGADYIVQGSRTIKQFADRLAEDFGEGTRKDAPKIYAESLKLVSQSEREAQRPDIKVKINETPRKPRTPAQVRRDVLRSTGQSGKDRRHTVTVSERAQVKRRVKELARVAKKAHAQGRREGIAEIKATIPVIKKNLRDAHKETKQRQEAIRKQALDAIKKFAPFDERGRFLTDVKNATTNSGLEKTLDKIEREIHRVEARKALKSIHALTRKAKLRTLQSEDQDRVKQHEATASNNRPSILRRQDGRQGNITTQQIKTATEAIVNADRDIREIYASDKADKAAFGAKKQATREAHVASTVANVERSGKDLKRDRDAVDQRTSSRGQRRSGRTTCARC